jgi:aspartate racemase
VGALAAPDQGYPTIGISSMHDRMIGILAGMGPRSTAPFIDAVVDQCQEIYGASFDKEFPKMMILSLPTPFYTDRPIDHEKMKRTIIGGLRELESTGVDFIAMPCNSAHVYYDDLASSIKVPLLNIIKETIANLGDGGPSSLFGTRGTLASGLYQTGFEQAVVEFEFHDDWQTKIDEVISFVKAGNVVTGAAQTWTADIREVKSAGVQKAVIACTDINAVLPFTETNMIFIDSTISLARAAVKKFLEIGA